MTQSFLPCAAHTASSQSPRQLQEDVRPHWQVSGAWAVGRRLYNACAPQTLSPSPEGSVRLGRRARFHSRPTRVAVQAFEPFVASEFRHAYLRSPQIP